MPALYYVLLEAETGKAYVRPFASLDGVRERYGFKSPIIRKALLLPEPFRFFGDSLAVYDGKPINFMASFYSGLNNNRVLYGDIVILKQDKNHVSGLDETELRFIGLSLAQSFGVPLPSIASA